MQDKNGREIRTGDVVRVTGAFFKNDNGTFFVTESPGDPTWCGSDHCLKRIGRKGKISTAKDSTSFWPLAIFTNDRFKRAEGNEWNEKNAQVEVIDGTPIEEMVEYFTERANRAAKRAKYDEYDFGKDSEQVRKELHIKEHYEKTIEYLQSSVSESDIGMKNYMLDIFTSGLMGEPKIIQGKSPLDAIRRAFPGKKISRCAKDEKRDLDAVIEECKVENGKPIRLPRVPRCCYKITD